MGQKARAAWASPGKVQGVTAWSRASTTNNRGKSKDYFLLESPWRWSLKYLTIKLHFCTQISSRENREAQVLSGSQDQMRGARGGELWGREPAPGLGFCGGE